MQELFTVMMAALEKNPMAAVAAGAIATAVYFFKLWRASEKKYTDGLERSANIVQSMNLILDKLQIKQTKQLKMQRSEDADDKS